MFHPDTQFLIDHWTALARAPGVRDGVPERRDLDPAALGRRLARAFVVDLASGRPMFRLAGEWIETLHDRALAGAPLASVWGPQSEAVLVNAAAQAVREARPIVLPAQVGWPAATLEVAFAPLRGPEGAADRLVGLYSPLETLTLAKDAPRLLTAHLSLTADRIRRGDLSLAAVDGRRVA